ncbi:cyclin-like protein [Coniochaeta ligniaria NRRL 30616]|uniref:RNA polymerase II holoenzyme cyclin-like subunit n=1 Tax=Coniochaeta ligniaria NRRL 30616 TaxID=1408157 RepID=A0A1J7JYS8_9PEZI|nr:cyclin-like protein [Coniochaeta ligniaria NRRL 30616]
MSTVDKWRPPREAYQPPSLPPKPPVPITERASRSPSRKREIPPAVPSPPTHSSRTSPPRPVSRRSAPSPAHSQQRTPQNSQQLRANQWYFTHDEVLSSPSVIDGLSPAEEKLRKAKGVNFIYQAGILLDLPQITLWVAGVFFHRFYMRFSMVEEKQGIHHYNIAATALFLANKTEENCRKTKDLIIAVAKVAQKNAKLIIDEQSKEYWRWRDSILTYEEVMLEALTFDLVVENPYQRLYEHLNTLDLVHNKRLRESAWAFCNDACLTSLPLLMEARDIAMAAVFFASTVTQSTIPDQNGGEAWWRARGGDEALMMKAIDLITDFYSENPLRKQAPAPGSPKFDLESTRRKGEDVYFSQNGTPMGTDGGGGGTQSPVAAAANSQTAVAGAEEDKEAPAESEEVAAAAHDGRGRGDSDAALKAAANDLDVHKGRPNGRDIKSPANKRKLLGEDQTDVEEGRDSKRARTEDPDEDEGEVAEE